MTNLKDEELLDELRKRMSDNRQALEELRILNEKLLTLNRRLEESERLKSHFISNISNEIVNPFTSILGLSRSILSVKKENWNKALTMVSLIHSDAFSLDFQLKNIFAAARIEAGEIQPETGKADIKSIISGITDSLAIEAGKKGVSFNLVFDYPGDQGTFLFRTDPEKLKLIISNLINNAVKFSFEGEKVDVITEINSGVLTVSVRDTGLSIPEEYKQIIYDRFRRIDTRINSLNRGHGLGLSVVASLTEMLGGNISFRNEDEKCTVFILNIPESDCHADSFNDSTYGNEMFFEDNTTTQDFR